jgi:hypothetical protein
MLFLRHGRRNGIHFSFSGVKLKRKKERFLAAMPPKTAPFSLWRGAAAPHSTAKADVAIALGLGAHGAYRLWKIRYNFSVVYDRAGKERLAHDERPNRHAV